MTDTRLTTTENYSRATLSEWERDNRTDTRPPSWCYQRCNVRRWRIIVRQGQRPTSFILDTIVRITTIKTDDSTANYCSYSSALHSPLSCSIFIIIPYKALILHLEIKINLNLNVSSYLRLLFPPPPKVEVFLFRFVCRIHALDWTNFYPMFRLLHVIWNAKESSLYL